MSKAINKTQRTLLLVVGLMLLPVIAATALYFSGWQPTGKPNGELLQPAVALHGDLSTPEGAALPLAKLEGRWHLVVAGAGACNDNCLALLDNARRIHVALYKQMPQVDRLWLSNAANAVEASALRSQQPDLIAAVASNEARIGFDLDRPGHRLYLMDPAGRVVMRYAPDTQPKAVLKDLERLLRFS
ncbi:MAG TPA: hypothetical protein VI279_10095 [Rhodocyclaceae bacterium]